MPQGRSFRVAVLAPTRHPLRRPFAGGLEAAVWQHCRMLAELGHRVVVFCPPGSDFAALAGTPAGRRIEVHPYSRFMSSVAARLDITHPPAAEVAADHAVLAAVYEMLDDPEIDIVHDHSLHHLPVALGKLLPGPLVKTLHTPPFVSLESAVALAGPRVNYTSVSAATAAQWTTIRPAPRVIANGIDPDAYPVGPGGDPLVWAGRITPEKGTHVAIAAARAVGRRLRIAGPVSNPGYFHEAVRPELDASIEYVGHLGESDLAAFYGHGAALLMTPLWAEPFGLVAAEAMMCGTPVVSFDVGGLSEVVNHGVSGVLAPSASPLTAEIAQALELDRDLVAKTARSQHDAWDKITDHLDHYAAVLAS